MRARARAACLEALGGRIGTLARMVDDETVPVRWRLQAIALMAKYGLGTAREPGGVRPEEVTALIGALADATEPFVDAADLPRLGKAWTAVVRELLPKRSFLW